MIYYIYKDKNIIESRLLFYIEVETMDACTDDCSKCRGGCSENNDTAGKKLKLVKGAEVKRVVLISGAKGGVGRSFITCALAGELNRRGINSAILDADAEGSSTAHYLGLSGHCKDSPEHYFPVRTPSGIQVISTDLALGKGRNPLAWRGEMAAETALAFWSAVLWEKVEVLLIDMPSGVSDIALALMQAIPADGILLVTQPDIFSVSLAARSGGAAIYSGLPVLGIIENMADANLPEGVKAALDNLCQAFGQTEHISIPYKKDWATMADQGQAESIRSDELCAVAELISERLLA